MKLSSTAFSRSLPNYRGSVRGRENTYLEADHDVNVAHLGSVLVELHCEYVGHEGVQGCQASEQEQEAGVYRLVPVLFANQAFGPLGGQPVEHPDGQDDDEGHDLVDVYRVSEHHCEQQELENFLLALVDEKL